MNLERRRLEGFVWTVVPSCEWWELVPWWWCCCRFLDCFSCFAFLDHSINCISNWTTDNRNLNLPPTDARMRETEVISNKAKIWSKRCCVLIRWDIRYLKPEATLIPVLLWSVLRRTLRKWRISRRMYRCDVASRNYLTGNVTGTTARTKTENTHRKSKATITSPLRIQNMEPTLQPTCNIALLILQSTIFWLLFLGGFAA